MNHPSVRPSVRLSVRLSVRPSVPFQPASITFFSKFQNSAKVYEYLNSYMGSVGFFEFMLLPEWKKELKVNSIDRGREY